MRLAASVVAAAAIAVLAVLAVAGSNRFSGPVLVRIGEHHGIHLTDILVAAVAWPLSEVVSGHEAAESLS